MNCEVENPSFCFSHRTLLITRFNYDYIIRVTLEQAKITTNSLRERKVYLQRYAGPIIDNPSACIA